MEEIKGNLTVYKVLHCAREAFMIMLMITWAHEMFMSILMKPLRARAGEAVTRTTTL